MRPRRGPIFEKINTSMHMYYIQMLTYVYIYIFTDLLVCLSNRQEETAEAKRTNWVGRCESSAATFVTAAACYRLR